MDQEDNPGDPVDREDNPGDPVDREDNLVVQVDFQGVRVEVVDLAVLVVVQQVLVEEWEAEEVEDDQVL